MISRGIRRGQQQQRACETTTRNSRTTATLFHLILLVRVLVSFHGILGIMEQYKDVADNDNHRAMTTIQQNLEQLMDMPDHHHLPLLLLIDKQQQQQRNKHEQKAPQNENDAAALANTENNDNQEVEEEEIDIVFPFAAAAAAAAESVHPATATTTTTTTTTRVSCGAHFASSCNECPQGNGAAWCNGDECMWSENTQKCVNKPSWVHPDYHLLLKEYPFQPAANENGTLVNVIFVRAPMNDHQKTLFMKYKDDILFLGISSFETFPLSSPNPYSSNFSNVEYRALFPGFLTMMRHPHEYFAPSVKTILMSQSDFNLDSPLSFLHDSSRNKQQQQGLEKKYDFVYSGTDQDVDNNCVGWSSFAKNWTFVVQALEVMCNETGGGFNLTGVLVATKNKAGTKACDIPASCAGKMVQTSFLENQDDFFHYLSQSKFAFIPQVYDASPRVVTQALAMNVPVLMNDNIVGGWKYLNDQTGEFFHDMNNFPQALQTLLDGIENKKYKPRKFVTEHYGNEHAGVKLKNFVMSHWGDRVVLPEGTRWLIPSGA